VKRLGMFTKILVCIGRDDSSYGALREAMRIASRGRAQLRLIHVIDDPLVASDEEPFSGTSLEAIELITLAGARLLREGRATVAECGLDCETVLCNSAEGGIVDLVARDAAGWHADLVMIGATRCAGIGRMAAMLNSALRVVN
jgi:nucleotide-binding universal stress UspA family protein